MIDYYIGDKADSVTFRCSQNDKIEIMTSAGELGVSVSSYCRMAALKELPVLWSPRPSIFDNDDFVKVISFAAAVLISTGVRTQDPKQKEFIKAETLKIRRILEEL